MIHFCKMFFVGVFFFINLSTTKAQIGEALNFDGQNDYVSLPHLLSNDFTIEFWIKTTQIGTAGTQWYEGIEFVYAEKFGISIVNNKLAFGIGNPDITIFSSSDINTNNWTHVAISRFMATGDIKLYINGNLEASAVASNTSPLTTLSDIYLGIAPMSATFFEGTLDELRCWSRVLTQCEIQTKMNCEFISPKNGLTGYYKFNQGLAGGLNTNITNLKDLSGKSNDGILHYFALSDTTSNWVTPGGVISGISCTNTRVSIYITSGDNRICSGLPITFEAVPNNGGSSPQYQWKKNSIDITGANSSTYTSSSFANNDTISCMLTNNTSCSIPLIANSNKEILLVTAPLYSFTGNGNWDIASNWSNNKIPPDILPDCSVIIVDPPINGECILNVSQIILPGGTINIMPDKKFRVLSDLIIYDSSSTPIHNSYFIDTTTNKGLGADTATYAELQNIPFVEDMDSSQFPFYNRSLSTLDSSFFIDVPPPGDQRSYGSCVGWAIGYGVLGYTNKLNENNSTYNGLDKLTSPTFIWNQLNRNDSNGGISIPHALELVKEKGCCKLADMDSRDLYSNSPSQVAISNAISYKTTEFSYWRFSTIDIERIKLALTQNFLIPFICEVDKGFMAGDQANAFIERQGNKYVWIKHYDSIRGNHAMIICGYDDNIQAFKILNSWGTGKGNGGFYWIDYNFFKKVIVKHNYYFGQPELYLVPAFKSDVIITTKPIIGLTATMAITGGDIIPNGNTQITERGVCYSTNIDPTTSSSLNTNFTAVSSGVANSFKVNLVGLTPNTKYYFRSYAKTSKGMAYGNKDSLTTPLADTSCHNVTDYDGNLYTFARIGTQCWMKENLRTTHYRNGDSIPYVTNLYQWQNDQSGAYCNVLDSISNASIYGLLYNWYAVNNTAGICPLGWHVPSDSEWIVLKTYLGGDSLAGGAMKDTTLWIFSNPYLTTNLSGFTALPAGLRQGLYSSSSFRTEAHFWSSTTIDINNAKEHFLINLYQNLFYGPRGKYSGISCRCIKDY